MSRRLFDALAAGLLLIVTLAGCGGPGQVIYVTSTPFTSSDLPAAPNPSPTPLVRPTLPAEWTRPPTAIPTVELLVTAGPTIDVTGTHLFSQPTRPACGVFTVDSVTSQTTYLPGEPIRLAWVAVNGAAVYRVSFVDATRSVLFERDVAGTSIDIPGSIVGRDPFYLWSVRPLDFGANQMCNSVGALLNIQM